MSTIRISLYCCNHGPNPVNQCLGLVLFVSCTANFCVNRCVEHVGEKVRWHVRTHLTTRHIRHIVVFVVSLFVVLPAQILYVHLRVIVFASRRTTLNLPSQFVGVHVPSFACVGTPSQLRRFLDEVRTGVVVPRYKARVIFDLDRSLITVNSGGAADEPVSVRPVKRNVLLLQVILCTEIQRRRYAFRDVSHSVLLDYSLAVKFRRGCC